jgi:hypothetical protein
LGVGDYVAEIELKFMESLQLKGLVEHLANGLEI